MALLSTSSIFFLPSLASVVLAFYFVLPGLLLALILLFFPHPPFLFLFLFLSSSSSAAARASQGTGRGKGPTRRKAQVSVTRRRGDPVTSMQSTSCTRVVRLPLSFVAVRPVVVKSVAEAVVGEQELELDPLLVVPRPQEATPRSQKPCFRICQRGLRKKKHNAVETPCVDISTWSPDGTGSWRLRNFPSHWFPQMPVF